MSEIKKTGLKAFLDGLKTYWGYVAVLSTILAVAYAKGVESQAAKSSTEVISIQADMAKDLKVIKDSIAGFSDQLQPVKSDIKDFKSYLRDSKNAYNGLREVVLDHTQKSPGMTLDQFKKYIESAPELKKNFYYSPSVKIDKLNNIY
jgi:hypothetical protein